MRLRHVCPQDYDRVRAVIDEWWAGRPMSARLSHVFFAHFTSTSFVLETDAELVGFLLGFLSQSHPDEVYVHFVGVHPDYRRFGLGRRLYERLFTAAQMHGRQWVRGITSPENTGSIAFHQHLGFEAVRGDLVVEGVPVWLDYAGAGAHRVVFRRGVGPEAVRVCARDAGVPGALSA